MHASPEPATSAERQSVLDRPFAVTFFKDHFAVEARTERYTTRALAERIRAITKARKHDLPWLKLASFGDRRTDKNSLRNDANVLAISGIEADYDGETLTFDEAHAKLEQQGIAAILYTSPSHTEDAPRWRILAPVSEELPADRREKMIGRLNGLFGGIFSGESFTLSQAYYYGSINHNPSHRVELVDGIPIDAHDDLDEIWRGRPHTETKLNGSAGPTSGPLDREALLREMMDGTNYHQATVRLAGYFAHHSVAFMEARAALIGAMDAVPDADRDQRWRTRRADIDRVLQDIFGKEAKLRDTDGSAPERGRKFGRLIVLGMDDLDTADPRSYLLKGLISPEEVSIWVGAPKCGKSFLLLHVSYMLSLGRSVFGKRVKPAKVLYVAAEGEGGIANRIRALRARYGASADFRFIAQPADLLHQGGDLDHLVAAARAISARLIVLDTLSRLIAGGDENSPVDMGTFVKNVAELRERTKAHVAIVHHGTKASNGTAPRGHSSLTGADDALIEVTKLDDGSHVATVVHAKDDADGDRFGFKLERVELGTDDDGDPIATLVVNEDREPPPARRAHLSDNLQIGLKTLRAAMTADAVVVNIGDGGADRAAVAETDWRGWFYREGKPGESQDTKQKAFRRIVDGLQVKGLIGSRDGFGMAGKGLIVTQKQCRTRTRTSQTSPDKTGHRDNRQPGQNRTHPFRVSGDVRARVCPGWGVCPALRRRWRANPLEALASRDRHLQAVRASAKVGQRSSSKDQEGRLRGRYPHPQE